MILSRLAPILVLFKFGCLVSCFPEVPGATGKFNNVVQNRRMLHAGIEQNQYPIEQNSVVVSAKKFVNKNFFILGIMGAIGGAKLAPWIGCSGGPLKPELTIGKFAVGAIFFLTGFKTKFGDLSNAVKNKRLNFLVQLFNLGFLPFFGLAISKAFLSMGMNSMLAEGLKVMMFLPTTVSMCIILCEAAGGSVSGAKAAFNAVIGNLLGLFITPAFIICFLPGASRGDLNITRRIMSLASKVVLPLLVGSLLRNLEAARNWQWKHRQVLAKLSEVVLLVIVYNTFCDAFSPSIGGQGLAKGSLSPLDAVLLPVALVFTHISSLALGALIGRIAKLPPDELPVIMFAGTHKTLAFGIPLLTTMFRGSMNSSQLAILSVPLLIYHPLELVIGSILVPKLSQYIESNGNQK